MTGKNILIISPEPWTHIFVSKHNYALELAKRGNKVFFLNPPSKTKELEIVPSEYQYIWFIKYAVPVKGQRFLPRFIKRKIDRNFYNALEKKAGVQFDVIWNFENSRFYDMGFAGNRLKIYHQVDLNQDFHVKEAARSADICFCTTDIIKRKIKKWNSKVFKVHHGVQAHALTIANELNQNENLIATYIGNLDIKYLDIGLLKALIGKFPNIQFKFVGNYDYNGNAYRCLSNYPNVTIVGPVKSENIKQYLNASDVLLVCYKADEFKDQLASPHKFMEYLASGKTIVATYTDEYKDKNDLLVMAQNNEDYLKLFELVINNITQYNSLGNQKKRIAFAKEHLYSSLVDKIIKLIKENVTDYTPC